MSSLTFLNHASFMVETEKTILIVDPWFEGHAFFNGWSLLDQSFTNQTVTDYLLASHKKFYIWYSHEHSDHFSTSFLQTLKLSGIECTILFQKTLDSRVINYVKKLGFTAVSIRNGEEFAIENDFSILVWSHAMGDSYCLVKVEQTTILNLNDCVVDTQVSAQKLRSNISSKVDSINILLTQFGYANWVGNEPDVNLRVTASKDKTAEIALQFNELKPEVLIPFASYVYFSHRDNFYLNDKQNTPEFIRSSVDLVSIQDSIFFLSPWQSIQLLPSVELKPQLKELSETAESYWMKKLQSRSVRTDSVNEYSLELLQKSFEGYRRKVRKAFFLLPELFERIGKIQSIVVDIEDLQTQVRLSYTNGLQIIDGSSDSWDIRLNSEVFRFILESDFGFNTIEVNGRFRLSAPNLTEKLWLFFSPQQYLKNGYGINHPFSSLRFMVNVFRQMVYKKLKRTTL
jgi:UDP-MurNAc hydroxylase